jgi:pyruvate,water dikinase
MISKEGNVVQSFTEDFRVTWKDPADGELTWTWDQMHFPRPVPPLTAHVLERLYYSVCMGTRSIIVNGYIYAFELTLPPPTPEVLERGPFEVWETEYVPQVREACSRLRSTNYGAMSAAELADSLDRLITDANDAFRYTLVVVFAFMGPTFELVDFCERELGPDGGHLLATLLQGFQNESAEAGSGLEGLAEVAQGLPEVAAALKAGRHDDLYSVTGGPKFLADLKTFLDEYGWRAESWGLSHFPTWAENPDNALMLIGRYLSDANLSPAAAIARSVRQREEAEREVEARLSGDTLAKFKGMLAACQGHVSISEGRAFWQLTIMGSLRVPFLALGRKLVGAGVLDEPNDVFYFDVGELKAAARDSRSQKSVTQSRRAELERWERLNPPPFVGAPPPPGFPPEIASLMTKFFGLGVVPSTEKNVITGNGASRGSATGRARVIRELSESGRLEKGDILVCPSTAPPWTPLFAIAAAVVTDSGGILSHSAICAREFGIPCVVGTQVGTREIPDGAMVTVDGAAGVVHIGA